MSGSLVCSFGEQTEPGTNRAPGWSGPHHCAGCAADVERKCAEFDADVAAGKYDEWGYTPAEARAARDRLNALGR